MSLCFGLVFVHRVPRCGNYTLAWMIAPYFEHKLLPIGGEDATSVDRSSPNCMREMFSAAKRGRELPGNANLPIGGLKKCHSGDWRSRGREKAGEPPALGRVLSEGICSF